LSPSGTLAPLGPIGSLTDLVHCRPGAAPVQRLSRRHSRETEDLQADQ